jgi:hypothetical protein
MDTQQNDWQSLSDLIARSGGSLGSGNRSSRGPRDLLTEHLAVAQRCLLGNMRLEYRCSLEHALSSLSCIEEKEERTRTRLAIRELIQQIPA